MADLAPTSGWVDKTSAYYWLFMRMVPTEQYNLTLHKLHSVCNDGFSEILKNNYCSDLSH